MFTNTYTLKKSFLIDYNEYLFKLYCNDTLLTYGSSEDRLLEIFTEYCKAKSETMLYNNGHEIILKNVVSPNGKKFMLTKKYVSWGGDSKIAHYYVYKKHFLSWNLIKQFTYNTPDKESTIVESFLQIVINEGIIPSETETIMSC